MATLSGNKIKDTYQSLIKLSDNGNLTTGAKILTDGFGNNSPLFLSTTQIGVGVTPTVQFHASGDGKFGGNLTVIGNLVVEGSTTTVGTDTLTVKDPLIVLANNNTSSDAVDIGFYGKYRPSSTTLFSGLFRDAGDDKFKLFKSLQVEPTTTVNTSGTGYAVATLVSNLEGNVTGNVSGSSATVTGAAQTAITSVGTLTALQVDNININGNTISSTAGTDLNITPLAGQQIVLDETIVIDAGVVTGATSITSTAFVGALTGDVTGNADTATKIASITNSNIVQLTSSQTLTNKTIDVDNNTVSNIEVDNLKSGVLDTDLNSVSGSDDTLASAKAIKTYVDAQVDTADTLSEVLALGNTTGATKIEVNNTSGGVDFIDNAKARFGTGNDAEIYVNSDNLNIVQNTTDKDIFLETDDGSGGTTTYLMADGSEGSLKLFHYGSKKFETTSAGVSVSGTITANSDSDQILNLNSSDSNAVYLAYQRGGSRKAYIGYGGSGNTFNIVNEISDGDISIVGNDGGVTTTVLSFDVSDSGAATFAGNVSAAQLKPTNIVTNKVVKFDGTKLDDSTITDTGSLVSFSTNATFAGSITTQKADNTLLVESTNAGQASLDLKNTEGHYRIITDGGEYKIFDQTDSRTSFLIDTSGNSTFAGNVNITGTTINLSTAGGTGVIQSNQASGTNTAGGALQLYGGRSTGNAAGGDIQFFVTPAGSSGSSVNSPTQAMHIEASTSNVGIGTTSPLVKLDVTSSGVGARFTSSSNEVPVSIFHTSSSRSSIGFKGSTSTNDFNVRVGADGNDFIAYTNNSERIRITSGGNVGIGLTNPVDRLDLYNSNDNVGMYFHTATSGTGVGNGLRVGQNNANAFVWNYEATPLSFATGGTARLTIDSSGNSTFAGNVILDGTGTDNDSYAINFKNGACAIARDNNDLELHAYDNMVFGVSNTSYPTSTERMRITSSGQLLLGITTGAGEGGTPADDNGTEIGVGYIILSKDNTNNSKQMVFGANGSEVGSISNSGSTTSFNTSSDYRLKEDLQDFAGLDMVSKIPVYDFKWKADESRSYGVMAHELEEVLPQAVNGKKDADEMQSVDYSKIVPLLVKSIQEQQDMIQELKKEIEILKNK